ncbi:choice-of-anchor P family protein [Actinophytocola sp.]|uniref:choice-of-anchor P family protein n=1 Tax=Actinophytocola sp. TaxID=1872138 RepID=UPI002D7EC40D|nr:choice-of-anchor P family protein [Actinophytocola sp.]HET9140920.1 choice-of-anchor P family protein [Actinophytocola sp.]
MEFRRRGLAVALSLVSIAVLGPVTAAADPPPPPPPPPPPTANAPTATGTVGYANAMVAGNTISIARLAACDTEGAQTGFTRGATRNQVSIGWGWSQCGMDDEGNATVSVVGSLYVLPVVQPLGGPAIWIGRYAVYCEASQSHTWSTMRVSGVVGAWLPVRIPPNYTMIIPGRLPTDPIVARIVLNEQIRTEPPDRSITVNVMRVQLFPSGASANRGEFVAGSVHCSSH